MADIREKIKKLLALAGSENENEARDALLKAKELMARNKLTEEDFSEKEDLELVHGSCEDIYWTTDSGRIWMVKLCDILAENYCCASAWATARGTRTHSLVVSGFREDVELCASAIRYAMEFINSRVKIIARKNFSSSVREVESSYAEGFLCGLEIAFDLQRDEHPEWALVVQKPQKLDDYMSGLSSKKVKTKKAGFDPLAYMHGEQDGMKFNTKKVLEAN